MAEAQQRYSSNETAQLQALSDKLLGAFKEATFDLSKAVNSRGLNTVRVCDGGWWFGQIKRAFGPLQHTAKRRDPAPDDQLTLPEPPASVCRTPASRRASCRWQSCPTP
jgi:hypothetical protein